MHVYACTPAAAFKRADISSATLQISHDIITTPLDHTNTTPTEYTNLCADPSCPQKVAAAVGRQQLQQLARIQLRKEE